MFGLGRRDFLAEIGGLFLVASALCVIGGYVDTRTDADAQRFSINSRTGLEHLRPSPASISEKSRAATGSNPQVREPPAAHSSTDSANCS
jgi:hypothetical protein